MNWDSLASIATAFGVCIAAWQIWESKKISSASFEDSFDQQYRALSYNIPVNALLGKELEKDIQEKARESVYNYLDLCNEQIYQRSKKRISRARWREWARGIEQNIHRPFFEQIWDEVKESAPGSFSYLEKFEKGQFKVDPVKMEIA